ncbi:MAG: ABC transporter permease [Vicinamibacterales bacterium]
MEGLLQDVRYASRMIARSPGITVVALVTIGIATGANATVFAFVSALLLRPAPAVKDPGSLVSVYTSDFSSGPYGTSSYPDYESIKADARAFADLAAEQDASGVVTWQNVVERVPVSRVTGNYFDLLGVGAASGRLLSPTDVETSAPPVAVVGHRLWRRALGAKPDVVGSALNVNGESYTVVGIAAEGFGGLDLGQPTDVWVPLVETGASPTARDDRSLSIVGRLRPGEPVAAAQAQVTGIAAALAKAFPESNLGTLHAPAEPRPMLVLRHTRMPPEFRPAVRAIGAILMAAVGIVLMIACANVASLLVSRAISRDREMAVRLALGAGRTRLIRLLLTESVLLGLGGGACGLLLALWTSDILPSFFPAEQAALLDTSVDAGTIAFVGGLAICSSLVFGLAPAWHATGATTARSLRVGFGRTSDGRGAMRLRRALVAIQVAAAVVLLVCSALLAQSLVHALTADLGFGTREGVVATVEIPPSLPESTASLYYSAVLDRVRHMPGVQAAAFVRALPLTRSGRRRFRVQGYAAQPGEDMELVVNVVSDGYFDTMQIPVRAGRGFDARDRVGAPLVVVVNDILANRFFDGRAIGRTVTDSQGREMEIVGVVQAHKYITVQEPPVATVYYPLAQEPMAAMSLVARVDGNVRAMIDPIRRQMLEVNPQVPVFRTAALSTRLDEATASERLTATLVSVCGGMALLLASIGLYGVVAHGVLRRAREIGIRVALGAQPLDIVRLILAEGLGITIVGIVLGLGAAALAARALGSLTLLYGVRASDPATYLSVPVILLVVALIAALAPARRALRLDPNVVLRSE